MNKGFFNCWYYRFEGGNDIHYNNDFNLLPIFSFCEFSSYFLYVFHIRLPLNCIDLFYYDMSSDLDI